MARHATSTITVARTTGGCASVARAYSTHPTATIASAQPRGMIVTLCTGSAPGSDIATNFPSTVGSGYQMGNGTSMAAAVVSGAAALLVGADPALTPDRLKFALTATARPTVVVEPAAVGAGVIDAVAARQAPPGLANQGVARSNGMGSLDLSRGTLRVKTLSGTVITGTQTAGVAVASDVGFMGGTQAHEFMVLNPAGEDVLVLCEACGYAANQQVATVPKPEVAAEVDSAVAFAEAGQWEPVEHLTRFVYSEVVA